MATSQIFQQIIFQEDDITWQSLIYELVREGKIDPWDIDISILAQEYLNLISKLKEMNFKLSGKVILAAAILLKLKAERIGLEQLLALTNPENFVEDDFEENQVDIEKRFTKASIDIKTPLPRKRKVTLTELIDALRKALEVDERRKQKWAEMRPKDPPKIPVKKIDIWEKIENLIQKLKMFVKKFRKNKIFFEELLPNKEKKEIIWTLLPLLHLAQENKVELYQEEPFGKILINIYEDQLNKKFREIDENGKQGRA